MNYCRGRNSSPRQALSAGASRAIHPQPFDDVRAQPWPRLAPRRSQRRAGIEGVELELVDARQVQRHRWPRSRNRPPLSASSRAPFKITRINPATLEGARDRTAPALHEPRFGASRGSTPVAPASSESRRLDQPFAGAPPDDKHPSVSTPDGRLLAAKSERVRLPNTSPNFRARALSVVRRRLDPQIHLQLTLRRP